MDENYDVCYSLICHYRKVPAMVMQDPGHKMAMFKSSKFAPCMTRIGFAVETGRWCNYEEKDAIVKPDRGVILNVVIRMGIQKTLWPSVNRSPVSVLTRPLECNMDEEEESGD